ncbi:hypothetical protein OSH11_18840 [Kaistia dalseonensis]|uniref:Uncharacterized protein n=1 Tax=Kaistia dalseonensis TaxID=410840 RepID=A0ABU0HAQ7_9HYPH|nr:hypothetical protein [Kaistia dalseonensis]MCX5496771.1 hypothetical protein [Kaistia dalseonensis]MDQ0439396.1 hypothetical protein [Kaistia dalseonensis]
MRNIFAKAALGAAFFVMASTIGHAAEPVLISYEATPSAGYDLPKLKDAGYAERAAFAEQALTAIVPKIAAAVGVDASKLASEVTPGGYLLKTNASLQSEADIDDATADKFAAGLGYVFRQYSVLVSRLDDPSGKTGFVTVEFPKDKLDAALAQSFFEKAASVDKGLGGGYTAFGDEQIFLNVTDSDGKPYSGLDNAAFLAGLQKAADSFEPQKLKVADSGTAAARFVDNDWDKQPAGDGYIARLGGAGSDVVKALDAVEADYAKLIDEAAAKYGWK